MEDVPTAAKDYQKLSLEFPNLETLNHFSRIVEFVGPMYVQDTKLGEHQHLKAKMFKRITNNHFESRDVLLLVRLFLFASQC